MGEHTKETDSNRNENDVDLGYVNKLENRLNSLKNGGKLNCRKILEEFATIREQQLFELISDRSTTLSTQRELYHSVGSPPPNNFGWLQRKIAPESLALNREELLGLVNCDLLEPISFCNTFSLHLLDQGRCPLVIDINGSLHWAEWTREVDDGISLKQCLDEPERDVADFDLELVASDSMLLPGNGRQTNAEYIFDGCIGTCWVLYDHLFAVARQFAVLFLILPNFHLKMAAKFPLQSAPTFSKIHLTDDHRFVWLVFTNSHDVTVFSVGFDGSVSQLPINDPMLAMPGNSGSVIRYEQIPNWGAHRLLLLGYDTGFLVASICPLSPPKAYDKTPSLIDRKCLKFDGPLSVLKVLKIDQMNVFVLVSSTLGPATVWSLRKDEEGMLGWHLVTVLKESELCDTVVTGTVYRSAANDGTTGMVLIGTYGELLLAYDLLELLAQQTHQGDNEVGPKLSINIASPVLAVEQFRDELLVLSNRGLHRLSPSVDGIFSLTQQRKPLTTVVNLKDEKRTTKSNKADAQ